MASEFARRLRREMTDAERYVWARIRYRQLAGYRFRRQAPVGPYIVDFVCFEARLVLELGGGQHAERIEEDAARTRWLGGEGFRVFRVWNNDVFDNWDGVVEAVAALLPPTRPGPADRGGFSHPGGGEGPALADRQSPAAAGE